MSLHQSVLDGSWVTARHLELFPMQEGSAGGPEVILNAKKHANLALQSCPPTRVGAGEGLAKEREAVDVEHLGQRTQEKQKERQRKEEKEKARTSLRMHKEKTERARPGRSCQRSDIVEG